MSRTLSSSLVKINSQLQNETAHLLNTGSLTLPTQKLYKYVEFLCRDKYQSKLTSFLYNSINVCINSSFDKLDPDLSLADFNAYVHSLNSLSSSLTRVYLYLDRTYLLSHPLKLTIKDYFNQLIVVKFWNDSNLGESIFDKFIDLLNNFRLNNENQNLIIETYGIFKQFDNFDKLNSLIIDKSKEFFVLQNAKDNKFEIIYQNILNEINLWNALNSHLTNTFKRLIIKYELLYDFNENLVLPLFSNKAFNLVSILYKLIINDENDSNLKIFTAAWSSYITDYLNDIIELNMNSKELILILINSRKNLNLIIGNFLNNDLNIEFKTREIFQSSINKSSKIITKLLIFLNDFFISKNQNPELLNDLFLISKSVKSKEIFLLNYKKDLSKRLILNKSNNITLELDFLNLLKSEINQDLMNPLFIMISDIEKSKKLKTDLNNSNIDTHGIEFTPLVLNSHSWPIIKTSIKLPNELQSILESYSKLYLSNNKNQKLEWFNYQSFMTIQWNLSSGIKQLRVSAFQGIVLLLFQNYEKLSFNEIKSKLKLDTKNLKSIVYSLSEMKYKVLKKVDDHYELNNEFKSNKDIIKIKQIKMKLKSDNEENENDNDYDDDEKFIQNEAIQAYIVRLLKFDIFINHDALINKVLEKFIADGLDIKKNIEYLIENEFISRDADGYRYIPA